MIDEVYGLLMEKTKSTPGAKVENNKFCLSVHFRCVEEKKWSELAAQVRSVLKGYPKLRFSQRRKVLEIRPTIKWDKGKALEYLLESLEGLVKIIEALIKKKDEQFSVLVRIVGLDVARDKAAADKRTKLNRELKMIPNLSLEARLRATSVIVGDSAKLDLFYSLSNVLFIICCLCI